LRIVAKQFLRLSSQTINMEIRCVSETHSTATCKLCRMRSNPIKPYSFNQNEWI
jgi:hypothetical protein